MDIKATQALERLVKGNERFTSGLRSVDAVVSTLKLAELAEKGQKPFAIILTCSDSRVPAEILFDQGAGSLFVIRVAGDIVAPSLLASIEFAALNFNTPLCLVMGHTDCGAIKAALHQHEHAEAPLSPSLTSLMKHFQPAVRSAFAEATPRTDPKELIRDATVRNVTNTIEEIQKDSSTLRKLIQSGQFMLVGGVCDIATGRVEYHWPAKVAQKEKAS